MGAEDYMVACMQGKHPTPCIIYLALKTFDLKNQLNKLLFEQWKLPLIKPTHSTNVQCFDMSINVIYIMEHFELCTHIHIFFKLLHDFIYITYVKRPH